MPYRMSKRRNISHNTTGLDTGLRALYLSFGILLGVATLSGVVLSSSKVGAGTEAVDDVSITIETACSMAGSGQDSHTATLPNGVYSGTYTDNNEQPYATGIGSTTLTIFCNDAEGFSIYATGYTGDEVGATNSNKLVGVSTGFAIPTGVYQSGTTTSSVWSMKVIKGTDTGDTTNHPLTVDNGFNNYHTVPGENEGYTRVAHKDAATDMTAIAGATLTTTYDAYISTTQAADTYQGKVKYVMVHPYMQDDSNAPTDTLIMQNVSQWGSSLNTGDEVAAMDARDGKTYTVAKLADGNLWMTQNLDHDIDSTRTYTPQDTDISANWTPSLSTYTTGTTTWEYSATTPESYDPGNLYVNPDMIAYYAGQNVEEPASATVSNVADSDSHYHLGNYYNWTAAVAMNDSSSYETDGTLIEQSICPAGWTLPRVGEGENTFEALWGNQAYGFSESSFTDTNENNTWDSNETALWTSPLYFAPSGDWYGELYNVGGIGDFWSSVYAYSADFYVDGGYVYPSNYGDRWRGYSVRCIARPVASSVVGVAGSW